MHKRAKFKKVSGETGFSLLELIIAMTITLAVMAAASTLLATSLGMRFRENTRSDALADAQRALNMMSREIGNSGYGLTDNGIATSDSGPTSIRIRANLNNNLTLADASLGDLDEDIRYVFQAAPNNTIVRFDSIPTPTGTTTVMANNINYMALTYLDSIGDAITDPALYNTAERVTIEIRIDLPASQGQPASEVRLVSDVALRNALNTLKQF